MKFSLNLGQPANQTDMTAMGYEFVSVLKSGVFGRCFVVIDRETGEKYVAKSVDITQSVQAEVDNSLFEGLLLTGLPYADGIVRCHDSFIQDNTWLVLILDFCRGGDLQDWLYDTLKPCHASLDGRELNDLVRTIGVVMLNIVRRLHDDLCLIHRDLKPANIFLSRKGDVESLTLGDFGVSKQLSATSAHARTTIGTPGYMAPEQLGGRSGRGYALKVDIYAIGVMLWETAMNKTFLDDFKDAGNPAFANCYRMQTEKAIPLIAEQRLDSSLTYAIYRMIQPDPHDRPSAAQILDGDMLRAEPPSHYLAWLLGAREGRWGPLGPPPNRFNVGTPSPRTPPAPADLSPLLPPGLKPLVGPRPTDADDKWTILNCEKLSIFSVCPMPTSCAAELDELSPLSTLALLCGRVPGQEHRLTVEICAMRGMNLTRKRQAKKKTRIALKSTGTPKLGIDWAATVTLAGLVFLSGVKKKFNELCDDNIGLRQLLKKSSAIDYLSEDDIRTMVAQLLTDKEVAEQASALLVATFLCNLDLTSCLSPMALQNIIFDCTDVECYEENRACDCHPDGQPTDALTTIANLVRMQLGLTDDNFFYEQIIKPARKETYSQFRDRVKRIKDLNYEANKAESRFILFFGFVLPQNFSADFWQSDMSSELEYIPHNNPGCRMDSSTDDGPGVRIHLDLTADWCSDDDEMSPSLGNHLPPPRDSSPQMLTSSQMSRLTPSQDPRRFYLFIPECEKEFESTAPSVSVVIPEEEKPRGLSHHDIFTPDIELVDRTLIAPASMPPTPTRDPGLYRKLSSEKKHRKKPQTPTHAQLNVPIAFGSVSFGYPNVSPVEKKTSVVGGTPMANATMSQKVELKQRSDRCNQSPEEGTPEGRYQEGICAEGANNRCLFGGPSMWMNVNKRVDMLSFYLDVKFPFIDDVTVHWDLQTCRRLQVTPWECSVQLPWISASVFTTETPSEVNTSMFNVYSFVHQVYSETLLFLQLQDHSRESSFITERRFEGLSHIATVAVKHIKSCLRRFEADVSNDLKIQTGIGSDLPPDERRQTLVREEAVIVQIWDDLSTSMCLARALNESDVADGTRLNLGNAMPAPTTMSAVMEETGRMRDVKAFRAVLLGWTRSLTIREELRHMLFIHLHKLIGSLLTLIMISTPSGRSNDVSGILSVVALCEILSAHVSQSEIYDGRLRDGLELTDAESFEWQLVELTHIWSDTEALVKLGDMVSGLIAVPERQPRQTINELLRGGRAALIRSWKRVKSIIVSIKKLMGLGGFCEALLDSALTRDRKQNVSMGARLALKDAMTSRLICYLDQLKEEKYDLVHRSTELAKSGLNEMHRVNVRAAQWGETASEYAGYMFGQPQNTQNNYSNSWWLQSAEGRVRSILLRTECDTGRRNIIGQNRRKMMSSLQGLRGSLSKFLPSFVNNFRQGSVPRVLSACRCEEMIRSQPQALAWLLCLCDLTFRDCCSSDHSTLEDVQVSWHHNLLDSFGGLEDSEQDTGRTVTPSQYHRTPLSAPREDASSGRYGDRQYGGRAATVKTPSRYSNDCWAGRPYTT